jgi:hypothetical protein
MLFINTFFKRQKTCLFFWLFLFCFLNAIYSAGKGSSGRVVHRSRKRCGQFRRTISELRIHAKALDHKTIHDWYGKFKDDMNGRSVEQEYDD